MADGSRDGGLGDALRQLCLAGMRNAVDAREVERYEADRLREERKARMVRRRDVLDMLHVPLDDDARRRVIRDDYRETAALLAVREALSLSRPIRYLVLTGGADPRHSVGTGKTTAAAHALTSCGGGVYIESATLSTCARSLRWEDRERLRMAHEAECLVIDELGIELDERARTARDVALFDVINKRQCKPKITILASNLSTRDLFASLDPRVRSRMGKALRIVDCTGVDMRAA